MRGKPAGSRIENVEVIFRRQPQGGTNNHFGSRLVFERAGLLDITLGDRGEQERAQRPDDHAGSVIRLHDDGRVRADNSFVGYVYLLTDEAAGVLARLSRHPDPG